MISYQQALFIIYDAAQKRELSAERISLDHALGRVCAEDLISPINVPCFDNSAMDGFALCSAATRGACKENPVRFAINGCIAAGDRPDINSLFAKALLHKIDASYSCTRAPKEHYCQQPRGSSSLLGRIPGEELTTQLHSSERALLMPHSSTVFCPFRAEKGWRNDDPRDALEQARAAPGLPAIDAPAELYECGNLLTQQGLAKGGLRGIFPAAIEIMTGAQLPSHLGADAVVKIEDVQLIRDSNGASTEFLLPKPITSGENVRRCGSDITQSEALIGKSTRILPEHIMALASVGISELTVLRSPKVAVISTGKELVHHSVKPLQDGEIYNSTAPYLMSALTHYGASPHFYGIVPDEPQQFIAMIKQILLEQPDIVISTGAVSVGKFDFVRACLEDLGATVCFHKVAIRPGKPLLFAELPSIKKDRGPVFFGIPGNPVPAAVCLRFFVEPYVRALSQIPFEQPISARLNASTAKPENLFCFFKAQLKFMENQAYVSVLDGQESFKVKPLLTANAWAVLKSEQCLVEQNTQVEVYPMHPIAKPW